MKDSVKEATRCLYVGLKNQGAPRVKTLGAVSRFPDSCAYICFAMKNLTLPFPIIFVWQRTAGLSGHQKTSSNSLREQMAMPLPLQRWAWEDDAHPWMALS